MYVYFKEKFHLNAMQYDGNDICYSWHFVVFNYLNLIIVLCTYYILFNICIVKPLE